MEEATLLKGDTLDIIDEVDGLSVAKQLKVTLRVNRAKRALKHSLKLCKTLLIGNKDENKKDLKEN